MSGGNINVPIVFRGPNGAALGVGAQHSQVSCITFLAVFIFKEAAVMSKDSCESTSVYQCLLLEEDSRMWISEKLRCCSKLNFLLPIDRMCKRYL